MATNDPWNRSVWCNHHLDHNHHAHHNHHNHNQVSFSGPMPDVTGVVWNGAALCKGDSPSGHNDKDDFDHTDDDFDHNDDDIDQIILLMELFLDW